MFTDIRRHLAAAFCTILMSSACVLSAVGPAQADSAGSNIAPTVAKAARFVA